MGIESLTEVNFFGEIAVISTQGWVLAVGLTRQPAHDVAPVARLNLSAR